MSLISERATVLIVEDHRAIGRALELLISTARDVTVVGVAADERSADRLIESTHPDVVLCDVMLGETDAGFGVLARNASRSGFVMYSAFELPGRHARALQLGAAGYVSKTADLDMLLSAIRRVASGGTWFPPHVLIGARQAPRPPTNREVAVIRLVVEGASNLEIARDLEITVKTVEGVLRRLFDRYDVRNRTELVRLTERQGWLPTTVEAARRGEASS